MSRRPKHQDAAGFNRDAVPAPMRDSVQWVCWIAAMRQGKTTKVPINPKTGTKAKSNDRSTWGSLDDALNCWRCSPTLSGIGFVLKGDDSITGIDLDDCLDKEGRATPDTHEIVRSFSSYTEMTPSGRGLRILIAGKKPPRFSGVCRSSKVPGIEVYDCKRFLTFTGERFENTPSTIESRPEALAALLERLRPPPRAAAAAVCTTVVDLSDDELLATMFAASNGGAIERLWQGDTSTHDGDDSGADLALCDHLAFYTGRDAERMDRMFRRSKLMRPKWHEARGDSTYGRNTIAKAIEGCAEIFKPASGRGGSPVDPNGSISNPLPSGVLVHPGGIVVRPGEFDRVSGKLLLSKKPDLETAKAFLRTHFGHADGRTLIALDAAFHTWNGSCFLPTAEDQILQTIQRWLADAICVRGKSNVTQMDSGGSVARETLNTLRPEVHVDGSAPFPRWRESVEGDPNPGDLVLCANAWIDVASDRVLAPTPRLLSLSSLEVAYDEGAPHPTRWHSFLDELFGGDDEARCLLQRWFGYCLLASSRHQKMLLIVGPPRSGKGTIARVLRAIVGDRHVASPLTGSLNGAFGLESLLGKSLAIVEDARFGGERLKYLVEILLSISGGGRTSVSRKHKLSLDVTLGTKFMFLANQVPSLPDPSGALASRFLVLELKQSFLDHVDITLADRLIAEAPGILLWAIEGLRQLTTTGQFVQPTSSELAVQWLLELTAPVKSFVSSRCVLGLEHRVTISTLFDAWKDWASERDHPPGTVQIFGRMLKEAGVNCRRREETGDSHFYEGIALREGWCS